MKLASLKGWLSRHRGLVIVVVVVALVAVALAIAAPLFATSTPKYFSRYSLLNQRFVNLEGSKHEGIGCRECHETNAAQNAPQLVGDFYSSLRNPGEQPRYFKFAPPTNEACLKCHEEDWSDDINRTSRIPHPAHTRVASEERECVSCHRWTAHLENYLDAHKKMPFSGVCVAYGCHVGTKQPDECASCHHVLRNTAAQWKKSHAKVVQTAGQNGCLEQCHQVEQCQECHTTGRTPEFKKQAIQVAGGIEEKHVSKDWTPKFHGQEALKNRKQCKLCHQDEGYCQECHRFRPAFHGEPLTWIGRHSKRTKKVDDPACIECHKQAFCDDCHKQFKEMR